MHQTNTTLQYFMLAMTLHPQTVRKAHAEIDKAIGRDRIPSFEDREQLPFVQAIIKEVLRWKPIIPLGAY